MCCTRLAENTRRKKSPSAHHRTICRDISSQRRLVYWQSENNLLNSIISPTRAHSMVNFISPCRSWDRLVGLGHPIKCHRVSRLGFVAAPSTLNGGQPNFTRYLAVSGMVHYYIHFRALLSPNEILPGAKFTLRLCRVFSYRPIGSVTAWILSSGVGVSQNLRSSAEGATYVRYGTTIMSGSAHILVCFFVPWSRLSWLYIRFWAHKIYFIISYSVQVTLGRLFARFLSTLDRKVSRTILHFRPQQLRKVIQRCMSSATVTNRRWRIGDKTHNQNYLLTVYVYRRTLRITTNRLSVCCPHFVIHSIYGGKSE